MGFFSKIRAAFSSGVDGIVGADRVFGTDSECLDGGPDLVKELFQPLGRIVIEHLLIERVGACASANRWFLRFFAAGRTWSTWCEPRDYGAVFGLVNEALHHVGAPRRVHVVSTRGTHQNFYVVYASVRDIAKMLDRDYLVEPGLPNRPHVLAYDGLRFFGHEPFCIAQNGKVIEAVLAEKQVIQGIPCEAGERIAIEYEGDLTSAVLAEDLEIGRSLIRAGSRVSFSNVLERIPSDVELSEEHDIEGFSCGPGSEITYYDDGALQCLTLYRAQTLTKKAGPYRGREVERGSTLWFDEKGSIEEVDEPATRTAVPKAPFDLPASKRPLRVFIDDVEILAREWVVLSDEGRLCTATIAKDTVIDGIPARGNGRVRLDEGHLVEAMLSREHSVSGVTLAAGSKIELWEVGVLSRGTLAFDQTFDGLACRGGGEIQLFDAGGIAECVLAKETVIDDITVPAGARIRRGVTGLTHVALPSDGTFLGFDALGGVWLAIDLVTRKVTEIVDDPF